MGRPVTIASPGRRAAEWLHEHGGTFADAAAKFGVSRQAVHQQWVQLFPDTEAPGIAEAADALKRRIARYRELAKTMTRTQIAELDGITHESVGAFCNRYGIEPLAKVTGYSNEQLTEARRLILEGKPAIAVATATGISYRSLRSYVAAGWLPSTRGNPGRRDGACAQASSHMDKARVSLTDAASKFCVSPPALYAFRKRRGLPTTL